MASRTPRVTGTDLGNAPGVGRSQNYIAKRLRGELPFNLDDLDRICAHLGIDSAALIRRVNERLSDPQQEGEENDR